MARRAHAVSAVCETLGVARSNVVAQASQARGPSSPVRRGRPPALEGDLLARIKAVIGDLPTCGDRRVPAMLRRQAKVEGIPAPNHERVYRVMREHGLLLARHSGCPEGRCHDGRISVDRSNLRWCSDAFEIGCDDGGKVRIAFALDCCDREAIGYVATTEGIKGIDIPDLMIASAEARYGSAIRLPHTIEWLSDNGSGYIARKTRALAREIGLEPRTTPVRSPQSNGMAEAFVRTMKRDYARVASRPSPASVIAQLPAWFDHYNTVHPHRALGYRSPREFIAHQTKT